MGSVSVPIHESVYGSDLRKKKDPMGRIDSDWIEYVYFVQSETPPNFIKIGKTNDLRKRFSSLRTMNASSIKLVGAFVVPKYVEGLFHELFKQDREHGEWFSPSQEITEMLARSKRNRENVLTLELATDYFFEAGATDSLIEKLSGAYDVANKWELWDGAAFNKETNKPELPKERMAYSVKEVMALIGISRVSLYSLINEKKLKTFKAGSRRLISHKALEEFIHSQE